ncbi:MAG: YceI family protein [Solirubrobacteraceae bacterium]
MVKLPGREHRKRAALTAAGAGVVLIVGAFLLVYFVIFPTSSPKPFKLTSTVASTPAAGVTSSTSAAAVSSAGSSQSWRVASGSQAGYRVREKLAFLPAESDAVGRTSDIAGAATLTDSTNRLTITAASFTVAVSTLKSDRSMRDEKIHEIGLESSRYPTATFVLSKAVALPASVSSGDVARVSVAGVFDIHGASKLQTLPVEFVVSGSTLEAAGSLTFPWREFGMTAPSVGGFVSVTGKATMEFDLRLQRA